MSNGSSLATPAVAAEHGDRCACRHCASGSHLALIRKADLLQHEVSRLERSLADALKALAVSEFKRLSAVIDLAIVRNDRETWSKAAGERMALGLTDVEASELMEEAA